jgi:hypothetical protein
MGSNKAPIRLTKEAKNSRLKFLRFFPKGFRDEKYHHWERGYKWDVHEKWNELLGPKVFKKLLQEGNFSEIANRAVRIESRTHLLFSFEKMAIRDGVRSKKGAKTFAEGLYNFLYGPGSVKGRFKRWLEAVAKLPRKQTRVLTWPILTVFGFIAHPDQHIYFKPMVTRVAAVEYGFDLNYHSPPSMETFDSLYGFVDLLKQDLKDLNPKDLIDIQSFIWVLGSSEHD